ncbi:FAD-binding oxidoreductase [Methylocystis sp. IM2]|uniref:FAD-binding oxidoreductase n=1 Tax=unclassified Methylocystis TaxID=2625913 RepID=UPI0040471367
MRAADVSQSISQDSVRDVAHVLSARLEGEVLFDKGSCALYAHDLSIYRHVPLGVVIPRHKDDVIAAVAECRQRGTPIFGRGCGTSLSGQTCNVAVVIDLSKYMNTVLLIDPDHRMARVQPGVVFDQLRGAAEKHGLTFAPDPATHELSCCRFRGHRETVFHEAGGWLWRDGYSVESLRSRRFG